MFSENQKYKIYYLLELNQFIVVNKDSDFDHIYPVRLGGRAHFKDLESLFKTFNEADPENSGTEYNAIYGSFERKLVHEFSSKEEFYHLGAEYLV